MLPYISSPLISFVELFVKTLQAPTFISNLPQQNTLPHHSSIPPYLYLFRHFSPTLLPFFKHLRPYHPLDPPIIAFTSSQMQTQTRSAL